MSRVLVTGATGFIGGHLVPYLLSHGHEVRCLVRRPSKADGLQQLGAELLVGDVLDDGTLRRAARGCDFVYHLAGKTSARRRDLYLVNACGSAQVARACAAQSTPPVLILVSSLAAAGTSPGHRLRTEADPPRPVSWYGRSKRAGELAAAAWSVHVPLSIVRPGIVFGPGNRELLPLFRSIARWGIHAVPGFTARRVSLIHHSDLLEILSLVAARGQRICPYAVATQQGRDGEQTKGIYFAVDPEQPTYAQLGRMIARAVGKRPLLVLPFPELFTWLTAWGNQVINTTQGRSDSLNVDKIREALAGDWTSSVARIRGEFGFHPQRRLQSRLNEAARWYRAHRWI